MVVKKKGVDLHSSINHSYNMAKQNDSVRAQIKSLEAGATAEFPLARYDYVNSCCRRLQNTEGKKFTLNINKEYEDEKDFTVKITRIIIEP